MRVFLIAALAMTSGVAFAETVMTSAADGTKVYGETYYASLPETAPLISLFHQARSNGRGEYGPLTDWLNGLGFRVIAWDQRSGGGEYGGENRTAAEALGDKRFCAAYPDVQAGIAFAHEAAKGAPLVIWGSSYSASLVFAAAAQHPDEVNAVVAMSTATGGMLDKCGAKKGLPSLAVPALALWAEQEKQQANKLGDLLSAKNVEVYIVKDGVHGSSMLVDERTKHDMSAARAKVGEWLVKIAVGD